MSATTKKPKPGSTPAPAPQQQQQPPVVVQQAPPPQDYVPELAALALGGSGNDMTNDPDD